MAHRAPDVHGIALNPAYFHAANLLIHLASASAVLVLLRRTVAGGAAAVIGAAVFALHPLQVEPVAWAGDGLYAVLSGALSLWALCHYVKFAQASGSKKVHATLASVLFVAALLSKPSAINVPLIAMVIDVMLLRRPLRKVWPLPAAWAAAGGIFVLAISRFHPTGYIDSPLKWRPIVALDAIGFYLGKLLVPLWLMPDYGRRPQWVMEHIAQAAVTCAGAL